MTEVTIDYTNHAGERSTRRILPLMLFEGANEWHPERQWLLQAYDVDRLVTREFAMKDIHSWKPSGGVSTPSSLSAEGSPQPEPSTGEDTSSTD